VYEHDVPGTTAKVGEEMVIFCCERRKEGRKGGEGKRRKEKRELVGLPMMSLAYLQ
jgi:hypothetical protein